MANLDINSGSAQPRIRIIWSILPIIITIVALQLVSVPATRNLAVVSVILVWGGTLISWFRPQIIVPVLRLIRKRIFLFWLLSLLYLIVVVVGWQLVARLTTCAAMGELMLAQIPCFNNSAALFGLITGLEGSGVGSSLELLYLLLAVWAFIVVSTFGLSAEERSMISQRLGQRRLTNVMISVTMLVVSLLALEVATRLVLDTTAASDQILIQQRWMTRHWNPVNELGYRDVAIDETLDEEKQQILITGDSYASGWGVKQFEDTLGQHLAATLEATHQVRIVARPGWDTVTELEQLQQYPVVPDVVVVSYVFNDIEYVSEEARNAYFSAFQPSSSSFKFLTDYLYLPNLLANTLFAPRVDRSYLEFLGELYADSEIWEQQRANILSLIEWAESQDAAVVALIWPDLRELEASQPLVDQVATLFVERGYPTIELGDVLAGQDYRTLVASPIDNHANAYVHGVAGELLAEVIAALDDSS